jgi:hypothetical protein
VTERLADAYRRWADDACGRSALYVELAEGVAGDRELLAQLSELPVAKQQPNLLRRSIGSARCRRRRSTAALKGDASVGFVAMVPTAPARATFPALWCGFRLSRAS